MAEVVGLAASVLQIGGAGAKLSIELYNYMSSASRAGLEIMHIAVDVELTSNVLDEVGKVLAADDAQKLVNQKAVQHARDLIKQCEDVFSELSEVVQKARRPDKDGKLRVGFRAKMGFPLKEQRVELLRRRLETLKSSLQVLFYVLQLAQAKARGDVEAASLEEQRDTIRKLHQQQQDSLRILQTLERKLDLDAANNNTLSRDIISPASTVSPIVNILTIAPSNDAAHTQIQENAQTMNVLQNLDPGTSDSEPISSSDEAEHLTFDQLAECAAQVQRLLNGITLLQNSLKNGLVVEQHRKRHMRKVFLRFCREFEANIAAPTGSVSSGIVPSTPLGALGNPSKYAVRERTKTFDSSDPRASPSTHRRPFLLETASDTRTEAHLHSLSVPPHWALNATSRRNSISRTIAKPESSTSPTPDQVSLVSQSQLRAGGASFSGLRGGPASNGSSSGPYQTIIVTPSAVRSAPKTTERDEDRQQRREELRRRHEDLNRRIAVDINRRIAADRKREEDTKQVRFEIGRASTRGRETQDAALSAREQRRAKDRLQQRLEARNAQAAEEAVAKRAAVREPAGESGHSSNAAASTRPNSTRLYAQSLFSQQQSECIETLQGQSSSSEASDVDEGPGGAKRTEWNKGRGRHQSRSKQASQSRIPAIRTQSPTMAGIRFEDAHFTDPRQMVETKRDGATTGVCDVQEGERDIVDVLLEQWTQPVDI